MLKVDFHTHTRYSHDSLTSIEAFINAARRSGLDRVVVTDHNNIRGALLAAKAAPELVIVGEEVQTSEGEFLAAFVTEELPRGLEPLEALKRLKDQGAFISISHPFDPQRSGWSQRTLDLVTPQVDAIEVFNARVIRPVYNQHAQEYAAALGMPGTAGSDAHHHSEIGCIYSVVPDFTDAAGLRAAIGEARVRGRVSSPLVHVYSTGVKFARRIWKNL